jgi:predicted metal-dependent hydrolase
VRDNGSPTTRMLQIGTRQLKYSLRFDDAPRLVISVYPDLTVKVRAPHGADPHRVDARVVRRGGWIHRQLLGFERYHPLPTPRRYVSGETHYYLGRQYRLRVRRGPEEVRLIGGFLLVTLNGKKRAKRLVAEWYRARAEVVFRRRLAVVMQRTPWLDGKPTVIRIRRMTRRWGGCGPGGVITLNTELVKAPPSSIDYILVHELCHRVELNHSKRFYELLRRAIPDWERARERLNRTPI